MNDTSERNEAAFEAELTMAMRVASNSVNPDVEQGLQTVRGAATGTSARRPQRILAAVAAVAVFGLGAAGLSSLGTSGETVRFSPAGETTTTSDLPNSPDEPLPTTNEFADIERTVVSAADVPSVDIVPAGGDAIRVVSELNRDGAGSALKTVHVFSDSGEELFGRTTNGPFERWIESTILARRDVLDRATPAQWREQMLDAGGHSFSSSSAMSMRNDRLWADARELLVSTTLNNDQRAFLFEMLELELGVSFAVISDTSGVPGGQRQDFSTGALEVRWNGHIDGLPRSLLLGMNTGQPLSYFIGGIDGESDVYELIVYEVDRVTMSDLQIEGPIPAPMLAVALDGQGLVAIDPETGESTLIPFGSARRDVVEMVEMAYGPPGIEFDLAECGGGPLHAVEWGALTLYFEPSAADLFGAPFLGWFVSGESPVIATVDGFGVGTASAELFEAGLGDVFADSTLGWEFFDRGISWVVSGPEPSDTLESFWAGESCAFR